jgi:hypothetical protein
LLTKISDKEAKEFYGQRDFPETQNKRLAIANSLSSAYKFLKFQFVLRNKAISKMLRGDLYLQYEEYCRVNNIRKCGKNEFFKKLEEINILPKKIVGQHYYIVELTELKKIAEDEKWVCKYDDVREEEDDDEEFIDELDEVKFEVKRSCH